MVEFLNTPGKLRSQSCAAKLLAMKIHYNLAFGADSEIEMACHASAEQERELRELIEKFDHRGDIPDLRLVYESNLSPALYRCVCVCVCVCVCL